jgi:hypothetical protein
MRKAPMVINVKTTDRIMRSGRDPFSLRTIKIKDPAHAVKKPKPVNMKKYLKRDLTGNIT